MDEDLCAIIAEWRHACQTSRRCSTLSIARDEFAKQRCWTVRVTEYCATAYLLRIAVAAPMWLRLGQNCVALRSAVNYLCLEQLLPGRAVRDQT